MHAVGAGIDSFDCATPTRLARHETAPAHDPAARWRLDLGKAPHRTSREPSTRLPVPGLPRAHGADLHYLIRANELTAKRLITLQNLTFMAEPMRGCARR